MTTAIVAGALANKPYNGGEAWVRLSWVLGLRRLGLDVWFVEQATTPENAPWFEQVVGRFGLKDRAALITPGASCEGLFEIAAAADLLLNISGNLTLEPLLKLPKRRAYVDVDPGYTQFWNDTGALGLLLEQHEHHLTVGLRIGGGACAVPTGGLHWRPVPPPVVLEEWPVVDFAPAPHLLTTVGSWRGGYGRVEHGGHLYGQKAHEFRRYATVPRHSPAVFEAALDIHPAETADVQMLRENGWELIDARVVSGDPDAFRYYVQQSAAEFSPAQGIYVETGSGWLSDRTTRYLASGRPAIVQDTALPAEIPVGEGLLSFRTVGEAVAAVDTVLADYDHHSRAARRIAEECLDSDVVLGALLEDLLP